MLAPRLPVSLDPLIAEAKQHMHRRRLLLALLVVVVLGASALVLALRPYSGSPAGRAAPTSRSGQPLALLRVPVDETEREWRASTGLSRGVAASPAELLRLREHIQAIVSATGATVVRMKIWRRTSPPAVELVAATNVRPAVYVRHRVERVMDRLPRLAYLMVVDPRGQWIFEYGKDPQEEFDTGARPDLEGCYWFEAAMYTPPCPVK